METEQYGGKLHPHSDLPGGGSRGGIAQCIKGDEIRWLSRRWDVGMWTGLGWPRMAKRL